MKQIKLNLTCLRLMFALNTFYSFLLCGFSEAETSMSAFAMFLALSFWQFAPCLKSPRTCTSHKMAWSFWKFAPPTRSKIFVHGKNLYNRKPQNLISIRWACQDDLRMGFRRDCFVLFCLSHFLIICVSTRVMWEHSHFVLRKFAKPAKVYAFQTLVIFSTYHNKKTCFSTIFREIVTST